MTSSFVHRLKAATPTGVVGVRVLQVVRPNSFFHFLRDGALTVHGCHPADGIRIGIPRDDVPRVRMCDQEIGGRNGPVRHSGGIACDVCGAIRPITGVGQPPGMLALIASAPQTAAQQASVKLRQDRPVPEREWSPWWRTFVESSDCPKTISDGRNSAVAVARGAVERASTRPRNIGKSSDTAALERQTLVPSRGDAELKTPCPICSLEQVDHSTLTSWPSSFSRP